MGWQMGFVFMALCMVCVIVFTTIMLMVASIVNECDGKQTHLGITIFVLWAFLMLVLAPISALIVFAMGRPYCVGGVYFLMASLLCSAIIAYLIKRLVP